MEHMNGHEFHKRLHARAPWIEAHPEDAAHNAAVSACVEGVFAGRPAEAVDAYNEWAVGAGYATLRLLSDGRIDICSCVLRIVGQDFVVQKCVPKSDPHQFLKAVCEGLRYVNEDEHSWYLEFA